tara:strand:+ start:356 stop:931 length:576 start_codon:yes stop_codon:yes gene_type:complete
MSAITALPSGVGGGSMNLISTQTASSSSTVSFTSGIDSTYKEYIFKFINIHPASNGEAFSFNMSTDSGSNYDVTKTSTFFEAYHSEGGSSQGLGYETGEDLAQSANFQNLIRNLGNDNDECGSGYLHLFNPSNTTFVKHFTGVANAYHASNFSLNSYISGYGNTTSAIDAVQFKMSSGNIDSGIIKLYGIS